MHFVAIIVSSLCVLYVFLFIWRNDCVMIFGSTIMTALNIRAVYALRKSWKFVHVRTSLTYFQVFDNMFLNVRFNLALYNDMRETSEKKQKAVIKYAGNIYSSYTGRLYAKWQEETKAKHLLEVSRCILNIPTSSSVLTRSHLSTVRPTAFTTAYFGRCVPNSFVSPFVNFDRITSHEGRVSSTPSVFRSFFFKFNLHFLCYKCLE